MPREGPRTTRGQRVGYIYGGGDDSFFKATRARAPTGPAVVCCKMAAVQGAADSPRRVPGMG